MDEEIKENCFFTICYKNKENTKKTAPKYTYMYLRVFKVALQRET